MENKSEKSLSKNSIFNLIYNFLNLLFPLVTSMYVYRILGPGNIGKVEYARNIVSYFVTMAAMGLPTYGIREIAKVQNNKRELNKVYTELLIINWVCTFISSSVFVLFMITKVNPDDRILFLCCGIELFLNFINIDWFYRGVEEYVYIVCRSIVIKLLSIMAIFLFVKDRNDYIIYALITSVAFAGNYLFNVAHSRHYVHICFRNLSFKQHFRPLVILGSAIFFSTIYSKLDITMLGSICSDTETGYYSTAFRLVSIILSVSASITGVFLPRMSHCFYTDREKFYEIIENGIRALSFLTFPLFVGIFLLAPQAIRFVFGEQYLPAVSTIRILSFLIVIRSFGDLLCYQTSIATGHEKERLPAYAIAACLNAGMNFLLIPYLGKNGAAFASVVSELLLNGIQFVKLKKLIGYRVNMQVIYQGVFTSLIMGVCILGILIMVDSMILQTVLAIASGVLVYFLSNFVLHNVFLNQILQRMSDFCKNNDRM